MKPSSDWVVGGGEVVRNNLSKSCCENKACYITLVPEHLFLFMKSNTESVVFIKAKYFIPGRDCSK